MNNYRVTVLIIFAAILFTASAAEATGKRKCAEDYRRFCSQWGLETRGLQNCMRQHGDQLTPRCIKGLIPGGCRLSSRSGPPESSSSR
jgi:hypothetical protein